MFLFAAAGGGRFERGRFGEASVVSRRRGRPSNNRLDQAKLAAIEAALLGRYADFGATLASEKLGEIEGVRVSKETVRQIQVRLGLWRPKGRRAKKIFQVRERRARFGERIQIDGSPHDWFEGRGPRCTLIVHRRRDRPAEASAIRARGDDRGLSSGASGAPAGARRAAGDRRGIFRVNSKGTQGGGGLTGSAAPPNGCASSSFMPRAFKTLPVPPPVEDDKTLDAIIARNASSATASSRKGVDNGLARYGAVRGALRQAVTHPTQPIHRSQKGDFSTWPEKGTSLLCLDKSPAHPLTTSGGQGQPTSRRWSSPINRPRG
jgi:hypothetical protein